MRWIHTSQQVSKFKNKIHMYFLHSNFMFLPGNLVLLEKAKLAKSGVSLYGVNIFKLDFLVSLENSLN